MNDEMKELKGRVQYLEKSMDELDLAIQDLKRDVEFLEDIVKDMR